MTINLNLNLDYKQKKKKHTLCLVGWDMLCTRPSAKLCWRNIGQTFSHCDFALGPTGNNLGLRHSDTISIVNIHHNPFDVALKQFVHYFHVSDFCISYLLYDMLSSMQFIVKFTMKSKRGPGLLKILPSYQAYLYAVLSQVLCFVFH